MEVARADLKEFFRSVSPRCSEDEFWYRIQEIINVLDIGIEEAWKIYGNHPPPLEVYWDNLEKIK
jgi:hypothetical protein